MSDDEIYEYLGRTFEWDRMKAMRNAIRHRVRFTDAAMVFFDPNAIFENDPDQFRRTKSDILWLGDPYGPMS
jgi:hypothetical protein